MRRCGYGLRTFAGALVVGVLAAGLPTLATMAGATGGAHPSSAVPETPNFGTTVETLTVDTSADTTPATPAVACKPNNVSLCSLRAAVETADTTGVHNDAYGTIDVVVPAGTYTLTQGEVVVTDPAGLVIEGSGAGPATVVITAIGSKNRSVLVATCSDTGLPAVSGFTPHCAVAPTRAPDLELSKLSLERGSAEADPYAPGDGGALYAADDAGLVQFDDVDLSDNSAKNGGAIFAENGDLWIDGSTIDDNTGNSGTSFNGPRGDGGGLYADNDTVDLSSSTIASNSASQGGGIYLDDASLQVTDTAVVENHSGGGIYQGSGATIDAVTTTIVGNTTGSMIGEVGGGGGIRLQPGHRTYPTKNSEPTTFTTTEPPACGGMMSDSTIAGNLAPNFRGGGIETDCSFAYYPVATTGPTATPLSSLGGNVVGNTSCRLAVQTDREGRTDLGYVLAGATGGAYNFNTPFFGSLPGEGVHVTDIAGTADAPGGQGYWMFGTDGGVFSFGNAHFHGSVPGAGVHVVDIVAMADTPTGGGYWLVGADGGVYAFGNAPFLGSLPGLGVSVDNIVGMAATPDGRGYVLVGSTGGAYAFGDGPFAGSLPGDDIHAANVVGMSLAWTGQGYFMVGATGGVYGFGTAGVRPDTSLPGIDVVVDDIVSIAAAPTRSGYWLFGATGGVYAFGEPFRGSVPGVGVHVTDVVGGFSI
jgi:predicted outer membrane repeat protein